MQCDIYANVSIQPHRNPSMAVDALCHSIVTTDQSTSS